MSRKKLKIPVKREPVDIERALRSWAALQVAISSMNLEEIKSAIEKEKAGKNRATILGRLATRYVNMSKGDQFRELLS